MCIKIEYDITRGRSSVGIPIRPRFIRTTPLHMQITIGWLLLCGMFLDYLRAQFHSLFALFFLSSQPISLELRKAAFYRRIIERISARPNDNSVATMTFAHAANVPHHKSNHIIHFSAEHEQNGGVAALIPFALT